jgi:uncharacterized protein (DUF58 family)
MRVRRRSPGVQPSWGAAKNTDEGSLLEARDLRQLERLGGVSLQAIRAGIGGQRPWGAGAAGAELVDYRPYAPGDDLRYVDWNIRARLGELLVKIAPQERRAEMDILIDMSRSMDFGRPNKLWHARRLAVALGVVGLLCADMVRVYGLLDAKVCTGPPLDSPRMVGELGDQVAALPGGVQTDLSAVVFAYRRVRGQADLVVLLSDGLVPPEALTGALATLARETPSIAFVHVLDPSELRAPARGPLELRDRETGRVLPLSGRAAATYTQSAARFRTGVERRVRALGARYLLAPTEVEPLDLLASAARAEGLMAW